jgi:hypothetical protein|tara:strand:- start:1075 stop:1266 length:192 start_codon:yes stop_codon:yes gene_type:complete
MSKLQVDEIVNKTDDGSASFPKGAVITGVATATSVSVGGTSVNTLIDGKTSPGKAIALSMVFG